MRNKTSLPGGNLPFIPLAVLVLGICLLASGGSALAASQTAPESSKHSAKLDPDEAQAASFSGLMPMPGEVFAALDSLETADWSKLARQIFDSLPPVKEMTASESAVDLGARTADAFLAVQAQDKELLLACANRVMTASRKLGASEAVLREGAEVERLAAEEDWQEINIRLDRIQTASLEAMSEVDDAESKAIAAAAGWLRGLEIFTTQLAANYSAEASMALRQAHLVQQLVADLEELPETSSENTKVVSLLSALREIEALVSFEQSATVAAETVASLKQLASSPF
jgi:hypothetical protein